MGFHRGDRGSCIKGQETPLETRIKASSACQFTVLSIVRALTIVGFQCAGVPSKLGASKSPQAGQIEPQALIRA